MNKDDADWVDVIMAGRSVAGDAGVDVMVKANESRKAVAKRTDTESRRERFESIVYLTELNIGGEGRIGRKRCKSLPSNMR